MFVYFSRDSHIWDDSVLSDAPRDVAHESHLDLVHKLLRGASTAINNCLPSDWLDLEYSLGLCICRAVW